jgi:hypothetical protein
MLKKFTSRFKEQPDHEWLADYMRYIQERGLAKPPLSGFTLWIFLALLLAIAIWRFW